jgi:hypothetical protein
MAVIFFITLTTAVLGAIIGWLSRGRIIKTFVICFLLSLLILAALMIANASNEGLTRQNWLTDLIFYQAIPFAFFIFGPCIVGGILTCAMAHSKKQRKKRQSE